MRRPPLWLPERFKNKMIDKIDGRAQRTEKTAEYPAEYYRGNSRKKRGHGKAGDDFP
jgi:hypothetical protein